LDFATPKQLRQRAGNRSRRCRDGREAMKETKQTLQIKWVRSGIGFPRRQKEFVRSLGLGRLNQVVERPDTAQVRGLVARIPHLVEIIKPPVEPSWRTVPEYTVYEQKPRVEAKAEPASAPAAAAVANPEASVSAGSHAEPHEKVKAPKPKAAAKSRPAGEAKEAAKATAKAAKKAEPEKKPKAAAAKDGKTTKKGKK
jgi:large subunit ribosomal protein L30